MGFDSKRVERSQMSGTYHSWDYFITNSGNDNQKNRMDWAMDKPFNSFTNTSFFHFKMSLRECCIYKGK